MEWVGKVVLITGGAAGIGAALVRSVVDKGARALIIADRDAEGAAKIAEGFDEGATTVLARWLDVGSAAAIEELVREVESIFGRIDIICNNAGIMIEGGVELDDSVWQQSWDINVMAHIRTARAAIPSMIAQGSGHILNIASAAGILTAPGAAAYTVTKHAAVGFAEWLAITYGDQGIGVSVVCPGPVGTDMLAASLDSKNEGVRRVAAASVVLTADEVAAAIINGVEAGRFLITPHSDTVPNVQRKWSDLDRWIGGMRSFLRVPTGGDAAGSNLRKAET